MTTTDDKAKRAAGVTGLSFSEARKIATNLAGETGRPWFIIGRKSTGYRVNPGAPACADESGETLAMIDDCGSYTLIIDGSDELVGTRKQFQQKANRYFEEWSKCAKQLEETRQSLKRDELIAVNQAKAIARLPKAKQLGAIRGLGDRVAPEIERIMSNKAVLNAERYITELEQENKGLCEARDRMVEAAANWKAKYEKTRAILAQFKALTELDH